MIGRLRHPETAFSGPCGFPNRYYPLDLKDVIFVADAALVQGQKLATLLQTVTGPVITGLLVCRTGNTKC